MAVSFSSSQIDRFKREAKKLVRELSMPHSDALDRIATQQGQELVLLVKHSDAATTIKAAPPMPRKSAFQIMTGITCMGIRTTTT